VQKELWEKRCLEEQQTVVSLTFSINDLKLSNKESMARIQLLERRLDEKNRVMILEERRNDELNTKVVMNDKVNDELKRKVAKYESVVKVGKDKVAK
jgi:hypothetical protein